MTSFPASPVASFRRLPLPSITPLRTHVASYLLVYILLSYNILYILYYKYTSLTDTSLFSPTAFTKGFIYYPKYTYLGRQKSYLISHSLYTFS
jgi:hypothetical protein